MLKRQYPSVFRDKKQKRDHNYLQAQIGFAAEKARLKNYTKQIQSYFVIAVIQVRVKQRTDLAM